MFNIDIWHETNENALIQTKQDSKREEKSVEKSGIKKEISQVEERKDYQQG